jgi:hypothetical protein
MTIWLKVILVAGLGYFALTLAGCADAILSNDRIRDNTAGILGVSPNQLTILDRRSEMVNTYYIARTSSGDEYACTINGGTVLSAGLVNPPMCTKRGANPSGPTPSNLLQPKPVQ